MKARQSQLSMQDIHTNRAIFLERLALYKKFGFDQEESRKKITDQLLRGHKSIIEIGTGKGHLTMMLAQSFDRVVSVDMDSDGQRIAMLNAAYNDQLNKIEFISADAGRLAYPDKSFDAVVSAFTFHHLDLPFTVIREMIRLAGSQIVISDFNRKGFEIVNKVHEHEGRIHEIKTEYFDVVGVYLREFDFDVNVIMDEYQIIYSAVKKDIYSPSK